MSTRTVVAWYSVYHISYTREVCGHLSVPQCGSPVLCEYWDPLTARSNYQYQLDRMHCIWGPHCNIGSKRAFPTYSTGDTTIDLFTNAQAVYFLHTTIPNITCLRLSDVSVICCVTDFFSVSNSVCFSSIWVTRHWQHCAVLVSVRNIGHWTLPRIWVGPFLYGTYTQGKEFELILTVKMETRHFVEGQFGSEFPAEVTRPGNFVSNFFGLLFGKTTPNVKIFNILFRQFYCLTDRRCCAQMSLNLSDGKSVKSCVIYPTKNQEKISAASYTRYCADRTQNLSWPAPNNVLTVLQISSKSVHFRRSYSRAREHRFSP